MPTQWAQTEKELKKLLGLKGKIKRIEGYDVSNIQGKQATGSMVVFEKNEPAKRRYRKFKIIFKQTPNDTAMLKEVLARRLKHDDWPLPEVILVDGGIAQLKAGLEVKTQMSNVKTTSKISNLKKTKIIALAKRKNELFMENKKQPVPLKDLPPGLANLILQIRDEAHRFAVSYHRRLRRKSAFGNF